MPFLRSKSEWFAILTDFMPEIREPIDRVYSVRPSMLFVSAIPVDMIALPPSARLFAYPQQPRPDGFTILDSGAFGLAQRGGKMTPEYMRRLAEYYDQNSGESIYCIAPDVYLNPRQTIANWKWWRQNCSVRVVPVIQFEKAKTLKLISVLAQARFYAQFHPPLIAISNPGLRANESQLMPQICATVRAVTGATWLHNLGAGWSPRDIADWQDMRCFDSIDTIAYYTDAQAGKRWRPDGGIERTGDEWRDIAIHNSEVARMIAHGTNIHH